MDLRGGKRKREREKDKGMGKERQLQGERKGKRKKERYGHIERERGGELTHKGQKFLPPGTRPYHIRAGPYDCLGFRVGARNLI